MFLASSPKAEFESPSYRVQRVPIWEVCAQRSNPNRHTRDSFHSLIQSLSNSGVTFPIIIADNPLYDPNLEQKTEVELLRMSIQGNEESSRSEIGSMAFAADMPDTEQRKFYPREVTDGNTRKTALALGTLYFHDAVNGLVDARWAAEVRPELWAKGEGIPQRPGEAMLAYIAWREEFTIPAVMINYHSHADQLSSEILHNSSKGQHSLDGMRDILNHLVSEAGMKEDWISQHLFIPVEAIRRVTQLSGIKSAYSDLDSASLAWNPEDDNSYERKMNSYLNREASNYVNIYLGEHPEVDSGERGDIGQIQDFAVKLGWDRDDAIRVRKS